MAVVASSSQVSPSASGRLPRLLKWPKLRRTGGGASLIRVGVTMMLSSRPRCGSRRMAMISSSQPLGRNSRHKASRLAIARTAVASRSATYRRTTKDARSHNEIDVTVENLQQGHELVDGLTVVRLIHEPIELGRGSPESADDLTLR